MIKTVSNTKDSIGIQMHDLVKTLYPINRSITGDGVRETLAEVSKIIPLTIHEVPSGTKAFDWEIPEEWNINEAWIKNSVGEKIIDFQELNLHVLNYSTPIHEKMSLKELNDHIFTLPDQPDLIPYRTSYHHRNWGFCMSHNKLESLADETYEVYIDSSIKPGSMTYGEYFIKGQTSKEVLFSTHICHPSLANDNLSGIAVASNLAQQLSGLDLYYSYRFLFIPGTIGSINWLSKNESDARKITHGLVLTLLGDDSKFHYKKSRQGNATIDEIVSYVLENREDEYGLIDFYPYGYDERQYCSPGFNLPVGRLSRKPHGEFPEYHTSADNLGFVKPNKLDESLDLLTTIVEIIESNKTYLSLNPKCEPQLGKRGLYKQTGGEKDSKETQMALLWVLNYADGKHSLMDIAKLSGIGYASIVKAASALVQTNLLSETDSEN